MLSRYPKSLLFFWCKLNFFFKAIKKWKTDLDTKVLLPDGRPIPCVLLGNKCDQTPEDVKFNNNEAMNALCQEQGFSGYFATSAKGLLD